MSKSHFFKKKQRVIYIFTVLLLLFLFFPQTCFAFRRPDVESAVMEQRVLIRRTADTVEEAAKTASEKKDETLLAKFRAEEAVIKADETAREIEQIEDVRQKMIALQQALTTTRGGLKSAKIELGKAGQTIKEYESTIEEYQQQIQEIDEKNEVVGEEAERMESFVSYVTNGLFTSFAANIVTIGIFIFNRSKRGLERAMLRTELKIKELTLKKMESQQTEAQ